MRPGLVRDFLHGAHVFTSTVQEVLGERYLRQTTRYDISVPQLELLRLIALEGDHQIRNIAAYLGVSQAAASKNVDKLVRLGLVTRAVQDRDRRAVSLGLTVRGRNLVEKYEAHKQQRLDRALGQMAPQDLTALARALEEVSYLILKQEEELGDLCMRCSAYYSNHCVLRSLPDGCIYVRSRKKNRNGAARVGRGARAH